MNKKTVILLTTIIFIGILLRCKDYFAGDFNYFLDQSRDLLLTRDIVVNRDITLIGGRAGMGGIFHGPAWLYMIIPFFLLSGGNPFWTLVPLHILVNISIIPIAFFVGKKLYNTSVGLFFAFSLSISSLLINQSFNTSNSNMIPLIMVLYLFSAMMYLRSNEIYAIVLFFLTGLSFQFESAFAIYLIPLTFFLFLLKKKIPTTKYILIGSIAFIVAVSTFILFEVKHGFLMTHSAIQIVTNSVPESHLNEYSQFRHIGFRTGDRAIKLTEFFSFPFFESKILGIIFALATVYLVFILKKFKTDYKKEYIFLIALPILYYTFFILYPFPLWDHYLSGLAVPAGLLFALELSYLIKNIKFNQNITHIIIISVLAITPIYKIYTEYLGKNKDKPQRGTYKVQIQIPEFIFNNDQNKTIEYFIYDPGFLTYNMDYLMWYLGKKHNRTISNSKNTPYIYLIMIEPPRWNPGAHAYWKEHVVKTKSKKIKQYHFQGSTTVLEKVFIEKNEEAVDNNYFQNLIFR